MTKAEAVKVLEMVEAHGLADEAKKIAIKELKRSGRSLIDADALKEFLRKSGQQFFEKDEIAMIIGNAPTVDESKTDDLIVLQLDCLVSRDAFHAIRNHVIDQVNEGVVLLQNDMHVAYIGSKCNVEFVFEEGAEE